MIVLGIDPGARWTALVVRDGDRLLAHKVTDRDALTVWTPLVRYAQDVVAIARAIRVDTAVDVTGVEGVVAPRPHAAPGKGPRLTDVGPTIETAWVAGALTHALGAVVVEPSGFGAPAPNRRVLEAMYPADLIGPRETTGSGKSRWQHLRAAWDIAGAVPAELRRQAAT